jgi:hypothetical protein
MRAVRWTVHDEAVSSVGTAGLGLLAVIGLVIALDLRRIARTARVGRANGVSAAPPKQRTADTAAAHIVVSVLWPIGALAAAATESAHEQAGDIAVVLVLGWAFVPKWIGYVADRLAELADRADPRATAAVGARLDPGPTGPTIPQRLETSMPIVHRRHPLLGWFLVCATFGVIAVGGLVGPWLLLDLVFRYAS